MFTATLGWSKPSLSTIIEKCASLVPNGTNERSTEELQDRRKSDRAGRQANTKTKQR
jgi:hypothetical protein